MRLKWLTLATQIIHKFLRMNFFQNHFSDLLCDKEPFCLESYFQLFNVKHGVLVREGTIRRLAM